MFKCCNKKTLLFDMTILKEFYFCLVIKVEQIQLLERGRFEIFQHMHQNYLGLKIISNINKLSIYNVIEWFYNPCVWVSKSLSGSWWDCNWCRVMMDLGQKFWNSSGLLSLVWVWKISPENTKFFPIWPTKISSGSGQKLPRSKTCWPLIYCRSKVCLGRVRSGPISNVEMFHENILSPWNSISLTLPLSFPSHPIW